MYVMYPTEERDRLGEQDGRARIAERNEVLPALRDRYVDGDKAEKGRALDELVARTGYHRKHAARLLRSSAVPSSSRRFYDDAVREALVAAWDASGRVGSRRLKSLLPELVAGMVRAGRLPRAPIVRGKLLAMSGATIDRLLAPVRAVALAEQRLARISDGIRALAAFRIPADLSPEERRRLETHYEGILHAMPRQGHERDDNPDTDEQ